jgi:spore coat protein U-like protein
MPLASTPRAAVRLLAGGLALAALGACSFSSENVSCSGTSCTVTLTGDGAEAEILGTTLSFGGTENGQASLTVAGVSVSCTEGESVAADPLRLECTSVDEDSVELTASLA